MEVEAHNRAMLRLVQAVQELSLARTLERVMEIVRTVARELTGADGATFVLKDGDKCFYADEDAIEPLWKGMRFPLTACISGWAMLNRDNAVIPDIYQDPRIPADAYRPTFVKSLAMVPIRSSAPIGAIGNYWARHHHPDPQQVALLQALADTTSVAMENIQVYAELERRVEERTRDLEEANRSLESFSYTVSHDLRAPLRAIDGFSSMLEPGPYKDRIQQAGQRMSSLIENLLDLARYARAEVQRRQVDLSALAAQIAGRLNAAIHIEKEMKDECDRELLSVALENLLSNACKYSSKQPEPRIEFSRLSRDSQTVYFVRDNGAGFDMQRAEKLFTPFQRLHTQSEFPGTGVGLATVHKIITRHGGSIWAESAVGQGTTFYFTLSTPPVLAWNSPVLSTPAPAPATAGSE
ncbi:MAG: GAF domain-containing protein [Candidatus Eremiobacteraeota bacterium]|nr:GAF domain-containing protein [Candidatus Eremiobacteraeota bacterium]MCW5868419.1 GAF domain-containing protein [Candidatus Eremiobacteraeota bacterium]